MFCSKCGKDMLPDSQFCPGCGVKLNGATDGQAELAKQHLKEASANITVAVKELSGLPHIGMKGAVFLHAVGLLIFFFPWVSVLGFSVNGFSIATNPKTFGLMVVLLLLIPVACLAALFTYYRFHQEFINLETARAHLKICGILAFFAQITAYMLESSKLHGIDVFTGWFYTEFLVWVSIQAALFWDKKQESAGN